MKSIEEIAEQFEKNELVRRSLKHSHMMKKGQEKGNKTRLRNRELERAFKNKSDLDVDIRN